MKQLRYLLLPFFLFFTITAFSQFTFGPKIGVNFSNVFDDQKIQSDVEPGMDAGIFLRIGDAFYFQPEFDYSFRNTTFKGAVDEIKDNFELKIHYFDVPLLLGYKFVNNPNFNFRLFIGPRLGFMLDNSVKKELEESSVGTVQVGGQVGLGIDFWRFTLDFKYDFSANKYETSNTNSWWKQNMINIALGFKILKP